MLDCLDPIQIPILWINLDRATRRRARMEWALHNGGWTSTRFSAIDARDKRQFFLALPNLLKAGNQLPGVYRSEESQPNRKTSRAELACMASWKRLLCVAKSVRSPSGWLLLMEDDLGATLANPKAWVHSLLDLIEFCPSHTLAIQLAPISAIVRQHLVEEWKQSHGSCLAVSKEQVRSHGNGAILINQKSLTILQDPLINFSSMFSKNFHPMLYPWRLRPVADKWLYAALPTGSCQVATYPHFCLDAEDSDLHIDHVDNFHKPSRQVTINIWKRDHRLELLSAQKAWDNINI